MSNLSYAIIGTGAIGGYYGARLQQSGCNVHFLLRSDYAQVKHQGLKVVSILGDIDLPVVQAHDTPESIPPVDVAIVALKTTQNHRVHELLPKLKPGGAVLCLQNGLGVEGAIARQIEAQTGSAPIVLGGLCFIGAMKTGPGQISHTAYGHILLGAHQADEQPCEPTPLLDKISTDFRQAAIKTALADDLPMARWQKLVWNVPYNGLSVVLGATTAEMMADSGVRSLITTLMEEVVLAANTWGEKTSPGCNRALPNDIINTMLTNTAAMASYKTSMKVDYDRRNPLEIAAIFGHPIRVAQSMGIAVPAMEMLCQQLVFLEKKNDDTGDNP